jgi:hypothetical protein
MISIENRTWIKFNPVRVSKFLCSQECGMKTTAKVPPTEVDIEIGRKLTHNNFQRCVFHIMLKVFENRVLRRVFGPRRDEVTR